MSNHTNAKFTLHDFSLIFHSPTGFDKLLTNAPHRRQIGARSCERQSLSVNYHRRDLRETQMLRRHPWNLRNIWHAKYLKLSAIYNPAVWMSSDWKIHRRWPTANERARNRAAGSSWPSGSPWPFQRITWSYEWASQNRTRRAFVFIKYIIFFVLMTDCFGSSR